MFFGGIMKISIKLTILAALLASNVNASAGLPQLGPKPKTHLTLTEAQILAIKNEMRGTPTKQDASLFADVKKENLEALLEMRFAEAAGITNIRNKESFEKSLSFLGLALQAWNPELRNIDIKSRIVNNIIDVGFVEGFVLPTMALLDKSYAIGRYGFGDMLNTMLADIAPEISVELKNQYGVSTDFNGRNFSEVTKHGRNAVWVGLLSQLDPDFYKEHNDKDQPQTGTARLTLPNDLTTDEQKDFINININGDKTAIAHYLKKIGHTDNAENLMHKRRIFQDSLGVSTKECAQKCVIEALKGGAKGGGMGAGLGKVLGKYIPQLRTAGYVIGASDGIDKCIASSECGGSKEQRAAEKAQKESAANEKEAQDKTYREAMDKYRQDEINKKVEADKNDSEKMKKIQKMKEEYENQEKETQEANDDNAEDDNSNSAEEENEHNRNGRNIKPMISDDEPSGKTADEVQKIKKDQGMPMAPAEVSSQPQIKKIDDLWVTKAMEKENNTKPILINVVYPKNPNAKD